MLGIDKRLIIKSTSQWLIAGIVVLNLVGRYLPRRRLIEGGMLVLAASLVTLGLAQNLDEDEIGVIVLGEFGGIVEGMEVTRTGEVLSVPVGDAYLGRVVDPLGNPIDGLGDIKTTQRRALELQAPGVMDRKSVHEPMQTGVKAIDAEAKAGKGAD